MDVHPDGTRRPPGDGAPVRELDIEAGIEDHHQKIQPGESLENRAGVKRRHDGFEDLLPLPGAPGISEPDAVSGSGDEAQAPPVQVRPAAEDRFDLRTELPAAAGKESRRNAQARERRRLIKNPAYGPERPEGPAVLDFNRVRRDRSDEAAAGHEISS